MSLVEGTQLGPYRIVAPLGSGGMGEVYRARDPRLDRDVALKVLPAEMAGDPARLERFSREARAIAALNHPHIVTIYSTEEAEGIRFITMELVEGQALDAMIPAGGLPLARFLELALPLADALTAAHQKQIMHRDLLPANVMVTIDGRVKVLDFGLARVGTPLPTRQTIEATRPVLTSEGTIVGTMPYMSPEQVEGKPLGRAAQPPDPALPREAARRPRPDGARCLQRAEARAEAARVGTAPASGQRRRTGRRRVDVDRGLPFATRGTDAEAVALAAGLTEDITTAMARFPSLSVVAPQSANSFKDSTLDIRQIAERIGARYIIGGSVRKSSSAVRIAVHLTDAKTAAQLWTETYEYGLDAGDIYAVQDEVTDRIVATIADKTGVLARALVQATRDVPLDRLTARELVYRCWGFTLRPTPSDHAELRAAVEAFIARQPDDAEQWAELAHLYIVEHSLMFNALPDPVGRGMRAARRALELDPSNQNGWVTLAQACFYAHDEPGLQEAVARVLRLNPRSTPGRRWPSAISSRATDGFAHAVDRILTLNPRNANATALMGALLVHAGEYERGAALATHAMTINPDHPGWYHFALCNRDYALGDYESALRTAKRINMPQHLWAHVQVALAAGQLGAGESRRCRRRRAGARARVRRRRGRARAGLSLEVERRRGGSAARRLPQGQGAARAVQARFCDGVAEEILNALTQIHVPAQLILSADAARAASLVRAIQHR